MTTARTIVEDALREIEQLATGETPTDSEAQDALRVCNRMIHSWDLEGVCVGHTDWTLTSTVTLPHNHEMGLVALLAVSLAPGFGVTVHPLTAQTARRTKRQLVTEYADVRRLEHDPGITNFDRNMQSYNIDTDQF